MTGPPDSELQADKTEGEAGDVANADSLVTRRRKRSASDCGRRSRSSSPAKRTCVTSALQTPPSPDIVQKIDIPVLSNHTTAAREVCLSPRVRQAYIPPHLRPGAGSAGTNIYIDGSSLGNGKPGARAGFGIWYEDRRLSNLDKSERLQGDSQTSSRAELTVSEQQ